MGLLDELAEAEDRVARLKLAVSQGPCREVGHEWRFLGGKNAGCGDGCACSVAVHECAKCGDCDYGDHAEAALAREECARLRA